MASPLLTKLGQFVLPWRIAAALIALINVAAVTLIFLRIDFNNAPELYVPPDSPNAVFEKGLRKEFPDDEALVAVFTGPDIFSAEFLTAQHKVAERLAKHPLTDRVFSVTTVDHIAGTDDGFEVRPLIDPDELNQSTPAERRIRILDDRFAPGLLVARDGSALALVVRPKALSESRQRAQLEKALHQAVGEAGLARQMVAVAGPVALDSAELRSMLVDSSALIPITMGLGLALLVWVVGRPVPVVIGAVAMGTVVSSSVALLVLWGKPFTLVTAMIPPLLSAYTVATLLHLYASLLRARQAGLRRPARVIRARADVHQASLFNVLTTGAGMASLMLTPIPPIQVFGAIGAIGTAIIYVVVFHLVPPLLVQFDHGRWPSHGSVFSWTGKIAFRLASFSMRRAGWVLGVAAVALVLAVPVVLKVEAESDLFKFFPADHSLTRSTEVVEDKLSGVIALEVVFDGTGRDFFKDVTRLRALKQVQNRIEALPEVDRTVSMVDIVEEMNWAFNGEESAYRAVPATDRALTQLLLIYDGKDLHEAVNREFQRTRLTLNVNVHGANAIGEVIEKIRHELERNPVPQAKWEITGYGRLFADQNELLVTGQIHSFWGAFGQILLLMVILWRSLAAGIICLVPNLAPLLFIFVVMGATGIHLDMATALIAGVVLGITVDDTIHLYHGYLHRLKQGVSPIFALGRSFEASGRAVLAISVLLVTQFALLTGSNFQPTMNFGLLSASGLLAGQMFELLLLPALVVAWNNYQSRPRPRWR